jgi:hypothetical protein
MDERAEKPNYGIFFCFQDLGFYGCVEQHPPENDPYLPCEGPIRTPVIGVVDPHPEIPEERNPGEFPLTVACVMLNNNARWGSGSGLFYDRASVLRHEIGHALGIGHTTCPGLMYPRIPCGGVLPGPVDALGPAVCQYGGGTCDRYLFGVNFVDIGGPGWALIYGGRCHCEAGCGFGLGVGSSTGWTYELAISEDGGPYKVFAMLQDDDWVDGYYTHSFLHSYDAAIMRMRVYEGEELIGETYSTYAKPIEGRLRAWPVRMGEDERRGQGISLDVKPPSSMLTEISFGTKDPCGVKLAVFDTRGRLVRSLMSGFVGSGVQTVSWDGRDSEGRQVASGVFFVRLEAAGQGLTRKVVIAR